MATDPLYLIVPDKQTARTIFQQEYPQADIRKVIGELKNHHIDAGRLATLADGRKVIEIPGSLEDEEGWHTKILNSQYSGKLKTKEEIWPLMPGDV